MTKRFFYTDPLAAAWMAKHFGMKIYLGSIQANNIWRAEDCAAAAGNGGCNEKFHTHPDSLRLLEIQVGDVIRDDVDHEYQVVWKDEKGLGMDTSKGTASPAGVIIQRDGKPFHWPESEEA